MPRPKTSEEAYESCLCKGLIKPQEDADLNRITSIIENSSTDIEQAKRLATITPKDGKGWTTIFKIQYDAARTRGSDSPIRQGEHFEPPMPFRPHLRTTPGTRARLGIPRKDAHEAQRDQLSWIDDHLPRMERNRAADGPVRKDTPK